MGAVRMTGRGAHVRENAKRYLAYKGDVIWSMRRRNADHQLGDRLVFRLPIATSRQSDIQPGDPHLYTPDLDNLVKAFFDAWYQKDSHIYELNAGKYWALQGAIEIWGVR